MECEGEAGGVRGGETDGGGVPGGDAVTEAAGDAEAAAVCEGVSGALCDTDGVCVTAALEEGVRLRVGDALRLAVALAVRVSDGVGSVKMLYTKPSAAPGTPVPCVEGARAMGTAL